MDAFQLQSQLLDHWRQLAQLPSGESAQKTFPELPVYVRIDQHLVEVTGVGIENNQIVIITE